MPTTDWFSIQNEAAVESPAVLVYPDRVRENIRRMIAVAGGPARLRPHVKTHKLPEIVRMQVEAGITRFKCATLSEAAMVAGNGASDILMAYPLYGPAVYTLLHLVREFPGVQFSALVDNPRQLAAFENAAAEAGLHLGIFLDLDVGMERTGIAPGPEAAELYRQIAASPWLRPRGLHLYDGHLHQSDPAVRAAAVSAYFEQVDRLLLDLEQQGLHPDELVCGGTPTFPIHARHPERILSPGTVLLWDWRYSTSYSDLDFLHAAVLLCRVVSKPGRDKLCLDLGHKALAAEMAPPRVHFPAIPEYEQVGHSEEHLVIAVPDAGQFSVGDVVYGIPIHICPTMALHDSVWVVEDGWAGARWRVTARDRVWSKLCPKNL